MKAVADKISHELVMAGIFSVTTEIALDKCKFTIADQKPDLEVRIEVATQKAGINPAYASVAKITNEAGFPCMVLIVRAEPIKEARRAVVVGYSEESGRYTVRLVTDGKAGKATRPARDLSGRVFEGADRVAAELAADLGLRPICVCRDAAGNWIYPLGPM